MDAERQASNSGDKMVCARCGDEIDPSEGLPVPTRTSEGKPGYLCSSCAEEGKGEGAGGGADGDD